NDALAPHWRRWQRRVPDAPAGSRPLVASVALIVHRLRPEAVRVAQETAAWLRQRGHDVRMAPEEADELDLRDCACEPEKLAAGLDLAVSLGGDGTILRTVELVPKVGVPVLVVNIGRLGYL